MPALCHSHGDALKPQRYRRVRLLDLQLHLLYRRELQQQFLRRVGCRSLQKVKPVLPHIRVDKKTDGAIVHGILNIVALSRLPDIRAEHRVDNKILPLFLLLFVDAMVRENFQIFDFDLIHLVFSRVYFK